VLALLLLSEAVLDEKIALYVKLGRAGHGTGYWWFTE